VIINPYRFAQAGVKPSTNPKLSWPTVANGNQVGAGTGGDWTSYYYSSAAYSTTSSPGSGRGAIALPNSDSRGQVFTGLANADVLSVSVWFRITSFAVNTRHWITGRSATAGTFGLDQTNITTKLRMRRNDGSGGLTDITANIGFTLAVDTWYHAAYVMSNTNAANKRCMWINGTQILDTTDGSSSYPGGASGGWNIGGTTNTINGYAASCLAWDNYTLTHDNVQYLYTRSPYAYFSNPNWTPST